MHDKVSGILLRATPYLGSARILTLFTEEMGLVSLIAKGASKKEWPLFTTPFCVAEWVFKKGKEEIHRLIDATLIDGLFDLKRDFTFLDFAGKIAQSLLSSQLPSKRGGDLYLLTLAYLKKLPHFASPEILFYSFQLKLLHWEGLLFLKKSCSHCERRASSLHLGELFCRSHLPIGKSIHFSEEEIDLMEILSFSRSFLELEKQKLPLELQGKVESLFQERMADI